MQGWIQDFHGGGSIGCVGGGGGCPINPTPLYPPQAWLGPINPHWNPWCSANTWLISPIRVVLTLGHTWPMRYYRRLWHLSGRLYVCLSIQFLLAYIHDWHQTITAYLPCPVLVPRTIILALWPLTLARWPLPWLCLLPQNCLNETCHQCQNSTFAAFCQYLRWVWRAMTLVDLWPPFQGHIGHHDLGLCLLVQNCLNRTSHQCQNCTFGEFYQYLGWVLTFNLLFKVR